MKRKLFVVLLAIVCMLACAFGLAACGNSGDKPENEKPSGGQEQKPGGEEEDGEKEPETKVANVGELRTKYTAQFNKFLQEEVLNAAIEYSQISESEIISVKFDVGDSTATALSAVKTVFTGDGADGEALYINQISFAGGLALDKIAEYDKNKTELSAAAEKADVTGLDTFDYDAAYVNGSLAKALYGKVIGSTEKATLYLKDNGTVAYPVEGGQRMFICRSLVLTAITDSDVTKYAIYVKDSADPENMLDEATNYKVARTTAVCELETVIEYIAVPQNDNRKVNFNANYEGANSIASMFFAAGKLMTGLPVPEREGYNFICWTDADGEEYTAVSVMPDKNLSLKAKWEKYIASYEDEYVLFKPALQGHKEGISVAGWQAQGVQTFVYVELTSDDLGGVNNVGTNNNFSLATLEGMEYKLQQAGLVWNWYQGDFSTPNGAQLFNLRYGSNVQLVTVSNSSGMVLRRYLLDIYVKHDYYINLYKNIYEAQPYDRVRVIENERFEADTDTYDYGNGFEFDSRVYYNSETETYERFVYSTAITKDWNLYQTYKQYAVAYDGNGGSVKNGLRIVPYSDKLQLNIPDKAGYDFIGWQMSDGKYFTDLNGYTGVNYLNAEMIVPKQNILKAVYAPKRMYHYFEDDVFSTVTAYPVVTYMDYTQTEILEIMYAVKGNYCPAPTQAPVQLDKLFKQWYCYDTKTGDGKAFDFDSKVTGPIALYAVMENNSYLNTTTGVRTGYNTIPLGSEASYTNNGLTYRAYLPTNGEYVLKLNSSRGGIWFTLRNTDNYEAFSGASSASFSVSSDNEYSCKLKLKTLSDAYFTFDATWFMYSDAKLTVSITGPTAKQNENCIILTDSNTYIVGEQYSIKPEKPAYTLAGWYDGDTLVSSSKEYIFTATDKEMNLTVEWEPEAGLNFTYEIADGLFTVTGIIDETVTELVLPDYVEVIRQGALSGCVNLENVILPFVGEKRDGTGNLRLEYIFGGSVPVTLKTVTVTGGNEIGYRAFYSLTNIEHIILGDSISVICEEAFAGCTGLKTIVAGSGLTLLENRFDYNCTSYEATYYKGTAADYSAIKKYWGFENIHYYSETEPTDDGNYWHYVDGVVVVWTKA